MNKHEELKQELKGLIEQGRKITDAFVKNFKTETIPVEFFRDYEGWYTKALYAIKQICPERLNDFTKLYKYENRKTITIDNFVISDALKGMKLTQYSSFALLFQMLQMQVNIVSACLEKFDSKIFEIQTTLQADIFDSELDSARHLLKNGFLRAAGAISGVVLEKHFSIICADRGISIPKKVPHLSDYNEILKESGVYDVIQWRKIMHLADIRNLCDHSKDREPTKEEVAELIAGVETITKTIF